MFDWKDYLLLAKEIHSSGKSQFREAEDRMIVSRAYYAAFCWARNYACVYQHFVSYSNGADHRRLIDHFKTRNPYRVAPNLEKLLGWRTQCDYQDVVKELPFIIDDALSISQLIIDDLRVKSGS